MTQHTTEINYDYKSKDYSVTVDSNLIGYASCYVEGEYMANEYITELTTIKAMTINTLKDVDDLSPEEEACAWMTERHQVELAKARAVPPTIDAQLADQGLRRASGDEAGWYVNVEKHGATVKVWATDEAPAASVPIMHSVTYIHPFSGETETAVVTVFAPIHAEAA